MLNLNYHYIDLIHKIIIGLAWPIVALLILYTFKDEIKFFLKNIKILKALGGEFETHSPNQTNAEPLNREISENENGQSTIELLLKDFEQTTIQTSLNVVKRETDIDSLSSDSDKIKVLTNYSMILILEKHFLLIYSYIYGSQIELLEKLKTNNFENKDSLKSYYDNAVSKSPSLYNDYSYGQYLGWLVNNNLIIVKDNNNVVITTEGIDFLKFLEMRNYPKTKHNY